jgi:hypothetical protein
MEDDPEEEGLEVTARPTLAPRHWKDKKGDLHRLNGPAVIFNDGDTLWYRHGQMHRDDGPARIWVKYGIEEWYKDGKPYKPSAHEIMAWKMKQKKKE